MHVRNTVAAGPILKMGGAALQWKLGDIAEEARGKLVQVSHSQAIDALVCTPNKIWWQQWLVQSVPAIL